MIRKAKAKAKAKEQFNRPHVVNEVGTYRFLPSEIIHSPIRMNGPSEIRINGEEYYLVSNDQDDCREVFIYSDGQVRFFKRSSEWL